MKKGFTLVELLVVISIIGVLIAVATVNLITAQKQARDSRRVDDMKAVETAFETYYSSNNVYPINDTQRNAAFDSGSRPTDPKNTGSNVYSWLSDADSYCVCALMESKTGNATGGTVDGCTWSATGTYFCVQNRQ